MSEENQAEETSEITIDDFANLDDLGVGQLVDPAVPREPRLGANLRRLGATNSVNVGQRNLDPLVGRDVDTGNSRHACISLLRMPAVLAKSRPSEGARL